ncbi:hypothetical protein IHE44_0008853 [Lamprotornis superbus]|uniref:J domain-containing protein n=1 Tax=Lamprotornis superbus TaxID=245042 RepID=A0A835NFH2_9PASS|nr:hypothetical protein IHE44_0008853 [Lamprotornis superbus]
MTCGYGSHLVKQKVLRHYDQGGNESGSVWGFSEENQLSFLCFPEKSRLRMFGRCLVEVAMSQVTHTHTFTVSFPFLSLVLVLLCHAEGTYAESPSELPANDTEECAGSYICKKGVILPIWEPQDPSFGDKIARATVYFVAMVYMFLGVSIIADRFMSSIEVITSQEREITIKKPNGETSKTTVRIWNETVSNLTLMALGSSAPEILLSVIEVCGHGFTAGDLGPSTIVGSAAFNMFVIIAICVYVVPDGEIRKIKHLRVFFVTAAWSIFAYTWLYIILSVSSPGIVEVWEGLLTFFFFPICVVFAWIADRRLLFYKYVYKKYRAGKQRGMIIEHEGDRPSSKADIEMDGKVANSHVESFLDGTLVLEVDEKDQDDEEARREMARILKELKQKHPDKEIEQLIELANYQVLSQQQKSRAFYRIQATRLMTGAGNILKRHAADQARKAVSMHEVNSEVTENDPVSKLYFEQGTYQCLENCGTVALTIVRRGGDLTNTVYVDFRTEDGTANAGSDYEFTEGTVVFKPGETQKEIRVGIIDDDIFEEDENFLVHLSNVRVSTEASDEGVLEASRVSTLACLGSPSTATVTIFDDDHAGIFTFEEPVTHISESVGTMEVKVLRTSGARGNVIVPYKTMEGTAKGGGEDFEDTCGELEFQNDEIVVKPLRVLLWHVDHRGAVGQVVLVAPSGRWMALGILPAAGLDPWAQNESDRPKSRQLTTASTQASVQTGRETSAAIQSQRETRRWTWQTESEAAPPQNERLSLEASLHMLQANECDQPALCSQGDTHGLIRGELVSSANAFEHGPDSAKWRKGDILAGYTRLVCLCLGDVGTGAWRAAPARLGQTLPKEQKAASLLWVHTCQLSAALLTFGAVFVVGSSGVMSPSSSSVMVSLGVLSQGYFFRQFEKRNPLIRADTGIIVPFALN